MHQADLGIRHDSFTASECRSLSSHFERTLIRTRTIDGTEWLFSDDVAAAIHMLNVDEHTGSLPNGTYREVWLLNCAGGPAKLRLVTTDGADALARRRRAPRSKRFREWLTTRTAR